MTPKHRKKLRRRRARQRGTITVMGVDLGGEPLTVVSHYRELVAALSVCENDD